MVLTSVIFVTDMHYDGVEVTPLISAINIWKQLKETVADDRLFEEINNLLYVQVRSNAPQLSLAVLVFLVPRPD